MEEKYSNIIKEAQELFDSILNDSFLVQNGALLGEQHMKPYVKRDVEICLTDNT